METVILASILAKVGSVAMVLVSLLLIGLILLQKNRGAGLSGAFGGVGGHTAFGTKTGDFLTWVTVSLAVLFLLLAVLLNFAFEPTSIAGTTAAPAPVSPAAAVPIGTDAPAGGGTWAGDAQPTGTPAAPTGG